MCRDASGHDVFPVPSSLQILALPSAVPDGPSFDRFIAPEGEAVATIATAPEGNYVSTIDERVNTQVDERRSDG